MSQVANLTLKLIEPTLNAKVSSAFSAAGKTIGISCSKLGNGETLTLQFWDAGINGAINPENPNDPGWTNYITNGTTFTCDINNNMILNVLDNFMYRVVKSPTATLIGVGISNAINLI